MSDERQKQAQDAPARSAPSPPEAEQPKPGDHPSARDPAQLAVELEQLRNRYLRARADLENYRKRSAQDVERQVTERHERLLRDWLEVIDSVDRALGIDQGTGMEEGLRAVLAQMQAVLARHGAERLEPKGERFNPDVHEAVATHVNDDVPDRTVLEVARAGYRLGDRVLRPAQVVVSRTSDGGDG